jgi:hypothetical protein
VVMQWRRASHFELATPCLACGLSILPGERCTIPNVRPTAQEQLEGHCSCCRHSAAVCRQRH